MNKPLVHLWTNPGRMHPEPFNFACGTTSFIMWDTSLDRVTCQKCKDMVVLGTEVAPTEPGECYTIYKASLLKHLNDNYTSETFKRQVLRIFEVLK